MDVPTGNFLGKKEIEDPPLDYLRKPTCELKQDQPQIQQLEAQKNGLPDPNHKDTFG